MVKSYKVTLGAQAYSFNDQATGFSISRGEVKELTAKQYSSKKIRKAINQGHLITVLEGEKTNPYTDEVVLKLKKKLEAQVKRGMTIEKISKSYSLEDLKHLAPSYEIEFDSDDTVVSLLTSIVEEINNE